MGSEPFKIFSLYICMRTMRTHCAMPCSSCIANKCFCEHMVNPIQKICQSLPFLLFLVKCPCRQPIYGSRFQSPAGNESFKASLSLAKVLVIKSFGGQFINFFYFFVTTNERDKNESRILHHFRDSLPQNLYKMTLT